MQPMHAARDKETGERRMGAGVRWGAVLLAALLLLIAGVRLYSWLSRGQETRVIVLVNPWNSVDNADFKPRLKDVGNGIKLDRSCVKDLNQMLADCRAAGFEPVLLAGYRDREEQQECFDRGESRTRPGYSEHELGLAVDLADASNLSLDRSLAESGAQKWLTDNCWRYGFIQRYPVDGMATTGVAYEPWHYRYVGLAAAEQINTLNITLEEYMSMFFSETAEIVIE